MHTNYGILHMLHTWVTLWRRKSILIAVYAGTINELFIRKLKPPFRNVSAYVCGSTGKAVLRSLSLFSFGTMSSSGELVERFVHLARTSYLRWRRRRGDTTSRSRDRAGVVCMRVVVRRYDVPFPRSACSCVLPIYYARTSFDVCSSYLRLVRAVGKRGAVTICNGV